MRTIHDNIILIFALRFLKPRNKFFPHIGVMMSSLAVAVSVAVLIIVTSVLNGFTADLIDKILGLNSHITIYKRDSKFTNIDQIQSEIMQIPNVKSVFPVVSGSGMLINNGESAGVVVRGIKKKDIKNNADLLNSVIGKIADFKPYHIFIGKGIARQLRIKNGDEISIIVPIVSTTMFGTVPRQVRLKVVGLIDTKSQQYDNYMLLMPFSTAQAVFNLKNNASSLEIMTHNPSNIDAIETTILNNHEKQFFVSDWKVENDALIHALKIESSVMSLILGLFVIISMFSIFAIIRMMIKSKEREIAILKAHGLQNKSIKTIFFIVGLVICITGLIAGNIFGIAFAVNIDAIRQFLENLFNITLFDGSVYALTHLPSRLMTSDIVRINIFAFLTAIFCTILSIHRNTKINIVKVLRND